EQLGAVVEDPVAQRQQVGVDRALTARGQGAHAVLDFLDGTVVEVGGVGPGQRGDVVDVELVEPGVLPGRAVDREHVALGGLAGGGAVDVVGYLGDDARHCQGGQGRESPERPQRV